MRLSVREQNMKLLLETVMCIMHCRKYHSHNCNKDSHLHNLFIHIFVAETVTCIYAADTSNCIIATETVTCIVVTERSTNMPVTESTISKPAKMQQTLHNCHRMCQLHSSNRNCHLQKRCQSDILLVTIKKLSKRVSTNFKAYSFSTPFIT